MDTGPFLLISILALSLISTASAQSIVQIFSSNNRNIPQDDYDYCESWRFSVETNDAGSWDSFPARCQQFVEAYMTSTRYLSDSEIAANCSLEFAMSVPIAGDGKDAWIFDIDETLLSNLPYYESVDFKWIPFNVTAYNEWMDSGEAPALPASLNLYKDLQKLGFTIFLLTGRAEDKRNVTVKNLLSADYNHWEQLILRQDSDEEKPAILYKSEKRAELENAGYKIHGSSGDQWSDLMGFAVAERSFKLPNPLYYVA